MKRIAFLVLLFGFITNGYGQSDTGKINSLIYNQVYKNIAAYYIRNNVYAKNETDERGYLKYEGQDLFNRCLPDKGETLDMNIMRLDWIYPIKGYAVYQVKLNGFRFSNKLTNRTRVSQVFDGPALPPFNYYLLIIDTVRENFKFISGEFFVNDISSDFKLNKSQPESYIEYLRYKTFQFQTQNIRFINRKGNNLYYSAYSNELGVKVIISMNSDHIDPIKLTKDNTTIKHN